MSHIVLDQDADLVDAYRRNGVVHVRGLLTAEEIETIKVAFTEQVERDNSIGHDDGVPQDDPLARYPRFVQPHRRSDLEVGRLARSWMLEPRLIQRVQRLLGPTFAAQSMFYFKPPTARGQALHQDNLFLQAHPETCLAAWIAVDDCDAENGGLMVVPGSHVYDLECPEPADLNESFSAVQVSIPPGLSTVQTEMRAGDVLFFHGSTVHGSLANSSADRFRRSLIFHYVPQASMEIATFYQPLLTPGGDEVWIDEAAGGGPCGVGWELPEGH
ncbi:phytanoyl-CoA dioxygenase family protein [Microlunatus parietis]|uniref:Ectoine hydroxylase-related dioxygenase (Phytanoyl-CoA dioxygenase family) n=1 Tax=Microlunatus parietis TaxID=682979 RepID=A0A7Y9LDS0_9ACTN|nr:phytanoyl-CoA dioxygenase family protein [Microlunatus parietis]NYE72256.1 ectoine hydroxylase-related dioxygenase (phytanoyl-CoA dioxygenase family) [Microlunatus parietis]